MNETFDGSFKIYMEPENEHRGSIGVESGRRGFGDDPHTLDMFSLEVDNVKEDLLNLEKLYTRLQESNEAIKNVQNAKEMKELRARLNMDLDHLFKMVKQINKKFDGLIRANAAQRKFAGSGAGSSDDQFRASLISQVVEGLHSMMRKFQALRSQMETDHRQLIEARYFTITREKATAEAIDNLIASEVAEGPLQQAMQELGRGPVLDMVAEIQERRETMKEVRRNLMALHQVLLGIASPVAPAPDAQVRGGGGGGLPSPVEAAPPPAMGGFGGGMKTGGLNDYERETRKQSYIAIAVSLVIVIGLIIVLLNVENALENAPDITKY